MPLREFDPTSSLQAHVLSPQCLTEGSLAWALTHFKPLLFPDWLFAGWRGRSTKGPAAWPAPILCSLLLMRFSDKGCSRRGACRRAGTDLQWRAALCVPLGESVPDEKTVREFEAFLLERHAQLGIRRGLVLHEHLVSLCIQHGVVGQEAPVFTADSTPMDCYGAVMDTINLLGTGAIRLLRRGAQALRTSAAELARRWDMTRIQDAKSIKGAFCVDWRQHPQRDQVVTWLVERILNAVSEMRHSMAQMRHSFRKPLLRLARHLCRIISQDLESTQEGGWRVARRVARGRMVSLTDPSARHSRKTQEQPYTGYEVHVLGEALSGLLLSVTVAPASVHEGAVTMVLIRRARKLCDDFHELLGDTAYGAARLRFLARQEQQVDIIAPPVSANRQQGRTLSKHDFEVDFVRLQAYCPGGHPALIQDRVHGPKALPCSRYRWSKSLCARCSLAQWCPKLWKWHGIVLHPYEEDLRRAREQWLDPQIRERYKQRSLCERLIYQMTRHGGRHALAFGLQNTWLQVHCIAMRCNLALLSKRLAETFTSPAMMAEHTSPERASPAGS